MKFCYPAVFDMADDGINVSFPDLPEFFTCGYSIQEAVEMATEALLAGLEMLLEDGSKFDSPSDIRDVAPPENGFVSYVIVDVDLSKFSKSVKKTLTIPYWMNEAALEKNLNFSKILQEALFEKLKSR